MNTVEVKVKFSSRLIITLRLQNPPPPHLPTFELAAHEHLGLFTGTFPLSRRRQFTQSTGGAGRLSDSRAGLTGRAGISMFNHRSYLLFNTCLGRSRGERWFIVLFAMDLEATCVKSIVQNDDPINLKFKVKGNGEREVKHESSVFYRCRDCKIFQNAHKVCMCNLFNDSMKFTYVSIMRGRILFTPSVCESQMHLHW